MFFFLVLVVTTTTTTTSFVQAWTAANRINKRTHPPHYYQRRGQHIALAVPHNDRARFVLHLKKKEKTVSSSTSQHQQQQQETKDASLGGGDDAFDENESNNNDHSQRQRHSIVLRTSGQPATVVSRRVPLDPHHSVTIWEWEHTAEVVEKYWHVLGMVSGGSQAPSQAQRGLLDPFGLVCWPGAVVAAQELRQVLLDQKRVLILGAGVGVEAQAAAQLGAAHVLATDVHPTTLQLLEHGAEQAGLSNRISTQLLDICAEPQHQHPLPPHDILVVADVLYNESLARHVIRRIVEARREHDAVVLVTDSQRFVPNFDRQLSKALLKIDSACPNVQWSLRRLAQFTGSGVLLDQDQTYEVQARVLWVGMEDDNDN